MTKIELPMLDPASLHAGDAVFLSGIIHTARDRAHQRLVQALDEGGMIPIPLEGAAIYYCGPCPAPPGHIVGSCGPTSAVRMDPYAPILYDQGVKVVIAKGPVSEEVRQAIIRNRAVYLCAAGGCGALLAGCVRSVEECAYRDLGTESIKRLEVVDMPLIVGIDSFGRSLFDSPREAVK